MPQIDSLSFQAVWTPDEGDIKVEQSTWNVIPVPHHPIGSSQSGIQVVDLTLGQGHNMNQLIPPVTVALPSPSRSQSRLPSHESRASLTPLSNLPYQHRAPRDAAADPPKLASPSQYRNHASPRTSQNSLSLIPGIEVLTDTVKGTLSQADVVTTAQATTAALNTAFQVSTRIPKSPQTLRKEKEHPSSSPAVPQKPEAATSAQSTPKRRLIFDGLVLDKTTPVSSRTKSSVLLKETTLPSDTNDTSTLQPGSRTRKRFFDGVVLEKRPPFSPPKPTAKPKKGRSKPKTAQSDRLGPPRKRHPDQAKAPKPRRTDLPPFKVVTVKPTAALLEELMHARVAPFGFESAQEAAAGSQMLLENLEFLGVQWKARHAEDDKNAVFKLASDVPVAYPSKSRAAAYVEGFLSAFGVDSLFQIPKTKPRKRNHFNRPIHTGTTSEETGDESTDESSTAEDVNELDGDLDGDVIEMNIGPTPEEALETLSRIEEVNKGVVTTTTEEEIPDHPKLNRLKRKLSAGSTIDQQGKKALFKLEDGTKVRAVVGVIDENTIDSWVSTLDVLVKGKVPIDHHGLTKIGRILDDIYSLRNSLPEQLIQQSMLASRVRQLAEMSLEDIPSNDEEHLRHKAARIVLYWTRETSV
ncbi:hypothetical protein AMATHDRAFT_61272, partial [Amanita thiersii Skay4041]